MMPLGLLKKAEALKAEAHPDILCCNCNNVIINNAILSVVTLRMYRWDSFRKCGWVFHPILRTEGREMIFISGEGNVALILKSCSISGF